MRSTARMLLVMATILVEVACGGSSSSSSPSPGSLVTTTATDRQQKLEEAARREGALNWDTSLAGDSVTAIQKAFEAKYPFIKMTIYRAAENDILTRVLTDAQAGHYDVDIIESPVSTVLHLREAGLLQPFYSPPVAKVLKDYRIDASSGLVWAASDRISYIGFGYNTRSVSGDAVPRSVKDLSNPGLRGKMGISNTTTGVRWVGNVLNTLGDSAGKDLLAQLAKQQVKPQAASGAQVMSMVAQGKLGASPAVFRDHAKQEAAKGASVDWVALEPVTANVGDVMVAAKAPHPAAAMLFADFLLGDAGQKLLSDIGYGSGTRSESFKSWVPETGLDAKKYDAKYKTWEQLFKQTFET
jgi:iron(III) transport system substrate-binding protein